MHLTVSGDFSTCAGAEISLRAVNQPSLSDSVLSASSPERFATPVVGSRLQSYTTDAGASRLAVVGNCSGADGFFAPVPSFIAIFTFGTTDVSGISGTPFD